MTEAPAASAPVKSEPTKIPPPVLSGSQGAGALAEGEPKVAEVNPLEFELDVKGQKQKLAFKNREQLVAVLQKALYADQVIKDGVQAKKGAEALMSKLKTKEGLREVLSDPEIGVDVKQWAIETVREMMDDEKLTPEQREALQFKARAEKAEKTLEQQKKEAEDKIKQEALNKQRAEMSAAIIAAMKKYPDIPQTQATMDALIMNMRAAYTRFGKHLTPDQAMSVYSEQYWSANKKIVESMTPEQLIARFGKGTLDKLQKLKLEELKAKTDPSKQKPSGEVSKKKHMTEKEFEKHFQSVALAGLG